jgi:NADH:ubiquinone oxidoreductase subunit E
MKEDFRGILHFVPNELYANPAGPHAVVPGATPATQGGAKHALVMQPSWSELSPKLESAAVQARVADLLKLYPVAQGALLEVLWVAQSVLGWVPREAIRWAAKQCGCSPAHAFGVATFYTMYQHAPTGRFLLQFCQNICCHIAGAEDVIAVAEKQLGVKANGGTTPDGLFTLLRVECLGACGNGPVMLVNDDFATDVQNGKLVMPPNVGVNSERMAKIIDWCRQRAASMPAEPVRDPMGGVLKGTTGHPGAPGATAKPQVADFAPPPPALGVVAVKAENGVTLTWKIAPEVTALLVERKAGSAWAEAGRPGVKDKDFVDAAGVAGAEYRIIATSGARVAKPSAVAVAAEKGV